MSGMFSGMGYGTLGGGLYSGSAGPGRPFTTGFESPTQLAAMNQASYGAAGMQSPGQAAQPQAPNYGFNQQLAGSYMQGLQKQWNGALQANQQQLGQMMGIANNYGQGEINASNQLGQQQQAQGGQQMASRGLYNSTVAQGMNNSIQGQTDLRNSQINDQTAKLQLGVLGQNTIQYPNLSAYASLASQPGAFSGQNGASAMLGALSKLSYGTGGK